MAHAYWTLHKLTACLCTYSALMIDKSTQGNPMEQPLTKIKEWELCWTWLRDSVDTCNIFFTLHKLGQELLKRKLTMVGMIWKNKSELPPQLLTTKNRPVKSSKFVYTADMSLLSYVPKKGNNVILMSTLHSDGRICGQQHQKPEIIMDYNATQGGVDNMDKLVTAYSCKRRPLVVFFDILDI